MFGAWKRRAGPSRTGRIGLRRARVDLIDDRYLRMRWRGRTFDLRDCQVRHRDTGGLVRFSVREPGGRETVARYRRRARARPAQLVGLVVALVSFEEEELWTWDDLDFGLYVFGLTSTYGTIRGNVGMWPNLEGRVVTAPMTEAGLRAGPWWGKAHRVPWQDLGEVRVKFLLNNMLGPLVTLVFDTHAGVATVPVPAFMVDEVRDVALRALRRLPGWDDPAEERMAEILRIAENEQHAGPGLFSLTQYRWAERPIWSSPATAIRGVRL